MAPRVTALLTSAAAVALSGAAALGDGAERKTVKVTIGGCGG